MDGCELMLLAFLPHIHALNFLRSLLVDLSPDFKNDTKHWLYHMMIISHLSTFSVPLSIKSLWVCTITGLRITCHRPPLWVSSINWTSEHADVMGKEYRSTLNSPSLIMPMILASWDIEHLWSNHHSKYPHDYRKVDPQIAESKSDTRPLWRVVQSFTIGDSEMRFYLQTLDA